MEDDYGDLTISGAFYGGAISKEQKRIAQGTPLDEIEEMLIRNRHKPIAISARRSFVPVLVTNIGHHFHLILEIKSKLHPANCFCCFLNQNQSNQ
jgi:hypothetical protein